MTLIKKPTPVDLAEYSSDNANPRAMYGLPDDIQYCSHCVYSNQKPVSEREYKHTKKTKKGTVAFNESGVCAACQFAEKKHENIDWEEREAQLESILKRFRSRNGSYDVLVPGSGGKDSVYAAHLLKYKYGMSPLTVTWSPHIYTNWGWQNFVAWINAGFDNYLFTPQGPVHRLLTRLALENLYHPFQPFILGQYYFPVRMAMKFNIPLVFYGENAAEYGNKQEENQSALKAWDYLSVNDRSDVHLGGFSQAELTESFGLKPGDLDCYMPPLVDEISDRDLEVRHLGYYVKWHPQSNYYYSVENSGFKAAPERTPGTYSKYSGIDDMVDDFHFYTTYIKFGIGRATYDASQEVRLGDIDRDEAVALVKRYDGEYPDRFENEVFKYLSVEEKLLPKAYREFDEPKMTREYFDCLTDNHRSPHLWQYDEGQGWRLRRRVWEVN